MGDTKDIGWMYEGAKSLVNREDYLLGKKIDKNFEKYSDAVNQQQPEPLDALLHKRTVYTPQPTTTKTSVLDTYVVATEDPLVAVKVKEETRRREVLENPLMKLKFQKMLKEMMAEKESKGHKKKKKKRKKKKEVDRDGPEKRKKKRRSRDSDCEPTSQHQDTSLSKRNQDFTKSILNEDTMEGGSFSRRPGSSGKRRNRSRSSRDQSKSCTNRSSSSEDLSRSPKNSKSYKKNKVRLEHRQRRRSSRSSSREPRRRGRSTAIVEEPTSKRSVAPVSPSRVSRRTSLGRSHSESPRGGCWRDTTSNLPEEGSRSTSVGKDGTRKKNKKNNHHSNKRRRRSSEDSPSSKGIEFHVATSPTLCDFRVATSNQRVDTTSSTTDHTTPSGQRDLEEAGTSEDRKKEADAVRFYDSHIPEHLRPKGLGTNIEEGMEDEYVLDDKECRTRLEGFGLVGVCSAKSKSSDDVSAVTENPYKLVEKPAIPVYKDDKWPFDQDEDKDEVEDEQGTSYQQGSFRFGDVEMPKGEKPERNRPLTEEEKEQKLREMAENAAWRQALRTSNLKRAHIAEEKEIKDELSGKAPSFIRSQLNSAASDLTVEQRLQSKKKSLQRSHGFMEEKFTSK